MDFFEIMIGKAFYTQKGNIVLVKNIKNEFEFYSPQ